MSERTFITRADDLGSSRSANRAIGMVADAGYIKNVSVMACGPYVEEAAALLADRKEICFGMHTTLNAEWDRVKWGPILQGEKARGIVDENGYFLSHPSLFLETKPQVENIMEEVSAQLDRLCALGFDIRYIDSHMLPELFVEGMDEAMEAFARKKGLVYHMYFYHLPPGLGAPGEDILEILNHLAELPDGQYFLLAHPSLDTEEMRMTGNAESSGEKVAADRARETKIFSDPGICAMLRERAGRSIRYDEAVLGDRLTPEKIMMLLEQPNETMGR